MSKRNRRKAQAEFPSAPEKPSSPDDVLLERIHSSIPWPSRSDDHATFWLESLDLSEALPESLSNAESAVDIILGGKLPPIKTKPVLPDEHVISLRRAARSGKDITREVEEAMQRARESAIKRNIDKDGDVKGI